MQFGGGMLEVNEPTPIEAFLEIRHQITQGVRKFTVHAYGSDRRQLISMLDRQRCSFIVDGKTIHINYD